MRVGWCRLTGVYDCVRQGDMLGMNANNNWSPVNDVTGEG